MLALRIVAGLFVLCCGAFLVYDTYYVGGVSGGIDTGYYGVTGVDFRDAPEDWGWPTTQSYAKLRQNALEYLRVFPAERRFREIADLYERISPFAIAVFLVMILSLAGGVGALLQRRQRRAWGILAAACVGPIVALLTFEYVLED